MRKLAMTSLIVVVTQVCEGVSPVNTAPGSSWLGSCSRAYHFFDFLSDAGVYANRV